MKQVLYFVAFLMGFLVSFLIFKVIIKQRDRGCGFVLRPSVPPSYSYDKEAFTKSNYLDVDSAEKYLSFYKDTHYGQTIAFTVDSLHIGQLLSNPNCKFLRGYFGVKNRVKPDTVTLMFVGVDATGENIFYKDPSDGDKEKAIDYTSPCPKDCPLDAQQRQRTTIKP